MDNEGSICENNNRRVFSKMKKKAFNCLTFLRKTLVVFLWMSSSCSYTTGGCISVLFRPFHGSATTKSEFPGCS